MLFGKEFPLSRIIAFSLTAIVVGGAVLSGYAVEEYVSKKTQEAIGKSISSFASHLQDNLDRGLFERHREISLAALHFSTQSTGAIRQWIDTLQRFDSDYDWIGLIDTGGHVLITTDQKRDTEDFLQQWPGIQILLKSPGLREAEVNLSYTPFKARNENKSGHRVELAAPVINEAGQLSGFLLATINWQWAQEIGATMAVSGQDAKQTEVFVLSENNEVLLGPPSVETPLPNLESIHSARNGKSSYTFEYWPDGVRYITGFAQSDGHRSFRGFGWTILVRQNADLALKPIRDLNRQIWTVAALFALHGIIISLVLGGDIAAPLLRLAKATDAVRRGDYGEEIPLVTNYAEAKSLSQSLISLVAELKAREAAQTELAAMLEHQVAERTAELNDRNISLEDAKRIAESATHAKSRFLAAASHDLRQPLHALMLFVRVLKRRVAGPDLAVLVGNIDSSVSSLSKMFDALLHVSRLDCGVISARLSSVPLRELLESFAAGFQAEARQRGLRFYCRCLGQQVVLADPALLETIIRNLLSNAMKFTKTGGILLASRTRGDRVLIEIYDTGRGIPAERLSSIFEEFERDQMQADGPNEGLGLGLSIVQRYAELMGAKVNVTSRLGRGTRFSIELALFAVEPRTSAIAPGANSAECLDKLRILLLDDNSQVLNALSRDLTDHGAIVTAFDSVEGADNALRAGLSADIAIVDYNLSGPETGLSFLERTKSVFQNGSASFILTGRTDTLTLDTISKSGITFLVKPADSIAIANHLITASAPRRGVFETPRPG